MSLACFLWASKSIFCLLSIYKDESWTEALTRVEEKTTVDHLLFLYHKGSGKRNVNTVIIQNHPWSGNLTEKLLIYSLWLASSSSEL